MRPYVTRASHRHSLVGTLPETSPAPLMPRKTFRELGTRTKQAAEFAEEEIALTSEELRERAVRARERLQAAGEIDMLEDEQPEDPPRFDSLVGVTLEINWRYWIREDGKRKGQLIWCQGTVVEVADPKSTQLPKKIRDQLEEKPKYRAVKVRWPRDEDFEEKEKFIWSILKPEDWRKQRHLGWMYAPCELVKLRAMNGCRK